MVIALLAALATWGCKKDEKALPELSGVAVSAITQNTAFCSCYVTDEGSSGVTRMGVCWGTSPSPTEAGDHLEAANGYQQLNATVTGLQPGTKYYVRAYARSSAGTGYGAEVEVTTLAAVAAQVTTGYATGVTTTGATLAGQLVFDGGLPATWGLCWGTDPNPTAGGSHLESTSGATSLTHALTGLTPSTTYHVRAYATTALGTFYGADVPVRTMHGSVTDVDGNTYRTVLIGAQEWMADNLKVTRYRTGDVIANITDNTQWSNTIMSGAYCAYNNDPANAAKYGLLYNHYTVVDGKGVCPSGWHVPSDAEWSTLITYVGGASVAGYHLKQTGAGITADNSSGFSGVMSGYRSHADSFRDLGIDGNLWSSTIKDGYLSYGIWIKKLENNVVNCGYPKIDGLSIRCIKD